MNIGKLFKSFVPTGVKQPRHTHGLPSRLGMESTALRWIVGESKACWTCKGDLPDSGGVVRFCSKVCRLRRHNKNGRKVQRRVRRRAA